ncbi:L,D-transpeptidase family protein [Solicola gregarius]|uniref:L,D-transpeptidase family protein n=1 Tax=Solicola gregarius TaxID=2908642 RepID=A0AA46YLC2_9ACTN|nr:L,D-transpeptidase family protein [Solicola gregarius]UYM05366.1 L,D-transpeptidase family protein [Solicola gregarius]
MMKRTLGAALAVTAMFGSILVASPSIADDRKDPSGITTEEVWGNDPTPDQTRAQARAKSRELASDDARKKPWFRSRFGRQTTHFGQRDTSAYNINHVRELQYRLRWAGVYKGAVTGYFYKNTRKAVKRFQRKVHIKRTGIATHKTWRKLIKKTIRGRKHIPKSCKSNKNRGPHLCYNRKLHEVTLWRQGRLYNAWLVRGGDRGYATRKGNFRVYYKDKDHVSSIYDSPMPNSQFFSGGQAFHGSSYMVDPFTDHSHGCVNMYIQDSNQLWKLTKGKMPKVHVRGAWD